MSKRITNITSCIVGMTMLGMTTLSWGQDDPHVAVLDTGADANVGNQVGGFNFFNGNTDTSDETSNNHGTTSARIVNQMAPGIPLFISKVTDGDFTPSASATDAAVLNAANNGNVRVIAVSDGALATPIPSMADASDAGKFVSIRAGNGGRANPDTAAVAASSLPGVVVVVGTNGGGGFLPNSNACGVTAARCVGAAGTTEFNSASGSSFAAARLAGIVAEVMRAAPNLSAEEVAQLLFMTAVDTGDPRIGQGFVPNAQQVINTPAGEMAVSGDGGSSGGAALAIGALAAVGIGLYAVTAGNDELETTLVQDAFDRPFIIDLTEYIALDDSRRSISGFFESLEQRYDSTSLTFNETHTLNVSYSTFDREFTDPIKQFAMDDDPVFKDEQYNMVFSLRGDYANGFRYRVGKNHDPSVNFGVLDFVGGQSALGRSSFISGQSFSMPLLGFSDTADSASLGFTGSNGLGLTFGLVNTEENRDHGRESVAAVMEGSYQFADRGKVSLQLGNLKEDGSLFGGASNTALSVDTTDTLALSLSGALNLTRKLSLVGNYGVAYSKVAEFNSGLVQNFSSVRSDWFGLGLIADTLFSRGDQFGVAFSQPLRIASGEADLHKPASIDSQGTISHEVSRLALEPQGREYTLESYYFHPVGRRSSVGAYAMLRHEANHVDSEGLELSVLGSYRTVF